MVEENARAPVHLRNDDALGAIDNEGAGLGHHRHVTEMDLLLLAVPERASIRIGVYIEGCSSNFTFSGAP